MHITMVGTGYVGLVTGVCFAEFGYTVTCVDTDPKKIDMLKNGKSPIYEPGLDDLLQEQIKKERIHFTQSLDEAMTDVDAVFIAVGTPPHPETGEADLKFVRAAAKQIGERLKDYTVVITKSTVPVGTAREVEKIINETNPPCDFDVVSNPEFLREGAAINDFMRPDRVVVGAQSDRARSVMKKIYRPLYLNETPILFTTRQTAEIIKYAANAFLATKITFINEMADLCEAADGDVQDVARAMGLDGRISSKFLHSGPGYGGSCFPKDTLALAQTGEKLGARQQVVEAVVRVNDERKIKMAEKIIKACGGSVADKTIGILGVAFKPNTDDVRESPSLSIIKKLQDSGAVIKAYDPAAMEEAKELLSDVSWSKNAYDAARDADALVIVTEWNEFRALDKDKLASLMKDRLIVDLRNIYNAEEMQTAGFYYVSVGRTAVKPEAGEVVQIAAK